MSFQAQIDQDLKEAMKARDADKLSVLRMLKAALKHASIEKGGATAVLDDSEAAAVVRKEVKKRQDAGESFEKGGASGAGRQGARRTQAPRGLSAQGAFAEEVAAFVREAIAEAGATSKAQMGAVMKLAAAKAAGRADGKTLSAEVARQLS